MNSCDGEIETACAASDLGCFLFVDRGGSPPEPAKPVGGDLLCTWQSEKDCSGRVALMARVTHRVDAPSGVLLVVKQSPVYVNVHVTGPRRYELAGGSSG